MAAPAKAARLTNPRREIVLVIKIPRVNELSRMETTYVEHCVKFQPRFDPESRPFIQCIRVALLHNLIACENLFFSKACVASITSRPKKDSIRQLRAICVAMFAGGLQAGLA
jgi:hypothetical protein